MPTGDQPEHKKIDRSGGMDWKEHMCNSEFPQGSKDMPEVNEWQQFGFDRFMNVDTDDGKD